MKKILLIELLFFGVVSGIQHPPIQGTFSIEYKQSDKENVQPMIEKVLLSGIELKRIAPENLLDEAKKAVFQKSKESCKDWKDFTGKQIATFAAVAAAYLTHYINGNCAATLKKRLLPAILRKHINPYIPGSIVGTGMAALALYPLIKFYSFFSVSNFENTFPATKVEGEIVKIMVFRRKTFSHSVRYGDVIIHYYNYSFPLGYMLIEDYEKMTKQFAKINRSFSISCLNACLCAGGLFWAATLT